MLYMPFAGLVLTHYRGTKAPRKRAFMLQRLPACCECLAPHHKLSCPLRIKREFLNNALHYFRDLIWAKTLSLS